MADVAHLPTADLAAASRRRDALAAYQAGHEDARIDLAAAAADEAAVRGAVRLATLLRAAAEQDAGRIHDETAGWPADELAVLVWAAAGNPRPRYDLRHGRVTLVGVTLHRPDADRRPLVFGDWVVIGPGGAVFGFDGASFARDFTPLDGTEASG